MLAEPPLVRPDGSGIRSVVTKTAVITRFAGTDNQHLIDIAVTVPVVETPVDVTLQQRIHDIADQVLRILVVHHRAPVAFTFGQTNELEIELQVELPITLVAKVLVHRPCKRRQLQLLGIEDGVPNVQRSQRVVQKVLVGEGSENGQLAFFAGKVVTSRAFILFACTPQHEVPAGCTATVYLGDATEL